ASFSSDPIPWDHHQQWFQTKLSDPGCLFLVAVDGRKTPVGQVRLEIDGEEAVISVSLAERFHGLGYGPVVIRQAAQLAFKDHPIQRINAYIRPENAASRRAFEKIGFAPQETAIVRGNPAHRLVLRREQTCSSR
ncbi:MAG TPA: GNAT family N-acetyltransferase, partial [Gemmataceae bacterium]|nr:GNAT family N-acetyltransferase [Gemmataceae bacterium]